MNKQLTIHKNVFHDDLRYRLEMENDNEECYYFERLERVLATQVDTFDIVIWVNSSSRFGHMITIFVVENVGMLG